MKKKILLTGGNWMLASDFQKYMWARYDIVSFDKNGLDITKIESISQIIGNIHLDIVLNTAAYTAVDDAEDIWNKENFEVNTLWVSFLAQICKEKNIDFITLSTDCVFDGDKKEGYNEKDSQNPINAYGMAKYLGERIAQEIYRNAIIVRISWLYGGRKTDKNFVNTILSLAKSERKIKVVDDQYGIPHSTYDVCLALWQVLDTIEFRRGKILHLSSSSDNLVSRADLARYICECAGYDVNIIPCSSRKYGAKAERPKYALLLNHSDIRLPDWKLGIKKYLKTL